MMTWFKTAIKNILLLIFAIGFCLIGLEIFAHFFIKEDKLIEKFHLEYGISQPRITQRDEDLGWRPKPNSKKPTGLNVVYQINSKGFRDKEIEEDVSKFRILALGESNVFGQNVGYGMRFTEIIEDSLENVEVLNMGVMGYGADQSLLQLERDGFQLQPRAVILFAIKDYFERCKFFCFASLAKPRFILNPEKSDIILEGLQVSKGKVKKITGQAKKKKSRLLDINGGNFRSRSKLITLVNYARRMQFSKYVNEKKSYRLPPIGGYPEDDFFKVIHFILERYNNLSKKYGAEFIVVLIDLERQKDVEIICRDLGIPVLRLNPILRSASEGHSLMIDGHYNNFAHKVIGESVSDYLSKKYGLAKNNKYSFEFPGRLGELH